jgi:hypothetical protein
VCRSRGRSVNQHKTRLTGRALEAKFGDSSVLICLRGAVRAVAVDCSFDNHLTSDGSYFPWRAAVAERPAAPACVDGFGCLHDSREQTGGIRRESNDGINRTSDSMFDNTLFDVGG